MKQQQPIDQTTIPETQWREWMAEKAHFIVWWAEKLASLPRGKRPSDPLQTSIDNFLTQNAEKGFHFSWNYNDGHRTYPVSSDSIRFSQQQCDLIIALAKIEAVKKKEDDRKSVSPQAISHYHLCGVPYFVERQLGQPTHYYANTHEIHEQRVAVACSKCLLPLIETYFTLEEPAVTLHTLVSKALESCSALVMDLPSQQKDNAEWLLATLQAGRRSFDAVRDDLNRLERAMEASYTGRVLALSAQLGDEEETPSNG